MPMLSHPDKKESTIKWFIIAIIPVVNLYFTWKLAESVSGHEKGVSGEYEAIKHSDKKDSTGKWFVIFLIPTLIGFGAAAFGAMMGATAKAGSMGAMPAASMGAGVGILMLIAFVVGIYVLYKVAICVSGHEKVYKERETLGHLDKKESTIKWMIFGIIPILNLYFLWKAAETVSGHEVVRG